MIPGSAARGAKPTRASPFRNRNFRWYWAGGLVSNVGTWLQNVSGSVYVLAETHSTFYVGMLNLATFIPIVLFSMAGGVIADRYDRRAVVNLTSAVSAVIAAVITVCATTHTLSPWLLITLTFGIGSSYAINKPAMIAMLPAVVPDNDISHATAINTLQFNIGQVVGSSLSTLLLALTSYSIAFGVNAISFVGPILAMVMLRLPASGHAHAVSRRGSGREGAKFVLRSPVILPILGAVILSNASVECLRTMAPAVTTRILHASQSSTGLLVTGFSVGATVGVLCFGLTSKHVAGHLLLVTAFTLQGIGLIGTAFSRVEWVSALCAVPIGLGFAFNIPILSGALQRLSPEEFRGRVMSFFNMAMIGMRPLFSVTAGSLGTFMSPAVVLLLFVAFPVIAIRLAGMTNRALQRSTAPGDGVPQTAPLGPAEAAAASSMPSSSSAVAKPTSGT
ncbi:MAG TPA: MFS transporter [Jatrophihabitans sp.]|nr:MFS transporter [Jatrophihabitans sp.]